MPEGNVFPAQFWEKAEHDVEAQQVELMEWKTATMLLKLHF